jgi:hypothetical protein
MYSFVASMKSNTRLAKSWNHGGGITLATRSTLLRSGNNQKCYIKKLIMGPLLLAHIHL